MIAAANQVRAQYGEAPLQVVRYRESDGGWEVEPAEDELTPLEAIGNWTELLAQLIDPRVQAVAARAQHHDSGRASRWRVRSRPLVRRASPGA